MQKIEESVQFIFSAIQNNKDLTSDNLKKLTSENIFEIVTIIDTLNLANNSFLRIIEPKNFNAFKIKFDFFSELEIEENDFKIIMTLLQNYDDELNLSMAVDENGEIVYEMTEDYFYRNCVRDLNDVANIHFEKLQLNDSESFVNLKAYTTNELYKILLILRDISDNYSEEDAEFFGNKYCVLHTICVKLYSEGFSLSPVEVEYLLETDV